MVTQPQSRPPEKLVLTVSVLPLFFDAIGEMVQTQYQPPASGCSSVSPSTVLRRVLLSHKC